MMQLTSDKKVYKCVCQQKFIKHSELKAHLLIPLNHIITQEKKYIIINKNTQANIKQRMNFIKSSNTQLYLKSSSFISVLKNYTIAIIKRNHKLSNISLNFLGNSSEENSKYLELTKYINLLFNQERIKEITNFKYLKNYIHNSFYFFLKSHMSVVSSFSIEENLKILVAGSDCGSVRIFCLENLTQIASFKCHQSTIRAIDIKSILCITGSKDSTICLFNLKTKKLKKSFKTCKGPILSLMLSVKSQYFLSGSEQGFIEIWSILKNTLTFQINSTSSVVFARFIQNDQFLICSTLNGYIQKFKLANKSLLIIKQFKKQLRCSSLIEETDFLLSGHEDGFIQVLKQFQLFKTFKAHSQQITSIESCLKTAKFVSASHDRTLKVWSLFSFSLLTVFDHFKQIIICVKLLKNKIYSNGLLNQIECFDLSSQKVIKTTNQRLFNSFILSVSIKLKLIVYGDERVYLYSLISNSHICCRSFESKVCYLVFASSLIMCGTFKGFIYCVDGSCLEIRKKYFFGSFPIFFVRTNWEVMCFSSENKSIIQDLRNSEILLTHNRKIVVGKFRENSFVFVDDAWDVFVSNNLKTIRKISNLFCLQLFWLRSVDYIVLKAGNSGFIILNTQRKENEIRLESLKGLKYMNKKREFRLRKGDLILSSLKFRNRIN